MGKQDDNVKRVVEILRAGGPMMAGSLGYELWGHDRTIRCENTVKTMYSRAAGKLLKRAKENTFWSDGYFVCSTGDANMETIKKYIEEQG